jgi:hypothetical protein
VSVDLTHWPSLRDVQGKRVRASWPAICARLARPTVTADKNACAGVSLATFRDDRRSLANVETVSAIGLDFDHELNWVALRDCLQDCASVIHTTWSSTPEARRARAFILLSRPVTPAEFRVLHGLASKRMAALGCPIDDKAADPSRFWFLPSHRPGGEFLHAVGTGAPWQIPDVIPTPTPPPMAAPQLSLTDAAGDLPSRAAAYLEHVGPAISGSGGSTHTFVVAQKLVLGFGLDDSTALSILSRWNQTCQPPWSERDLRRKIQQARERGTMVPGKLANASRSR